jgi:hypothetical protein
VPCIFSYWRSYLSWFVSYFFIMSSFLKTSYLAAAASGVNVTVF